MTSDEETPVTVTRNARRQQWLCFGIALLAACAAATCDNPASPSTTCTVTVTADGRTGTGSGATTEAALMTACAQIGLNSTQRNSCEQRERPAGVSSWSFRSDCST